MRRRAGRCYSRNSPDWTRFLILQPHLGSETGGSPFDMEVFGPGLMSPSPAGPVQHFFWRRRSLPDQPPEESAHFGDCQREELSDILLLNLGPLFCPATLTTVKKARANIANVICMLFGIEVERTIPNNMHYSNCDTGAFRIIPIPPLPIAYFIFIQSDLLLGPFKGYFHLPPASRRPP